MFIRVISCLCAFGPLAAGSPSPPPVAAAAAATASQSSAAAAGTQSRDKAIEKTVRGLINAIRYNKDDLAVGKLALRPMSQLLMGEDWGNLSEPEQAQFAQDLAGMLKATSFVRGREMFAYLDAMLFERPKLVDGKAHIKSTIVVHRELKKIQLPIEWVLTEDHGALRVVDIISMNESTLQSIREDEVMPLLKAKGPQEVLKTLHARLLRETHKAQ